MHVSQQLRRLRCELNLSQERFGKRLGLSGKSVSAYETGRCLPTVKTLQHISAEFNTNFTEMSTDNRVYLSKRLEELETSVMQLKAGLSELLSL
jgi:transcriptional regulator with XRE-family HTH domain